MTSDLRAGEVATADTGKKCGIEAREDFKRELLGSPAAAAVGKLKVALLTGGADRPYAYGLSTQLMSKGIDLDIIGSDELDCPELHDKPGVNFLNLRGEQNPEAGFGRKAWRVLAYYLRLIHYACTSNSSLFHILWNNKFETFDRTLLMLFYKMMGKKILLTVHNVNAAQRDSKDSFLNRLTLRVQYRLADHLFVHSEKMKSDLMQQFGVPQPRVTVIPFGINNAVPNSELTGSAARRRLGFGDGEKLILFFGNIAPYKGLEYLVAAFQKFLTDHNEFRLIIAGRPKGTEEYWTQIQHMVLEDVRKGRVLLRSDYIPDPEIEVFFKAADILVLPYRYIYQSGVLFLGYSFGLPVVATGVGSMRDEIIEGTNGYVCRPQDPADLAATLKKYFSSELYLNLDNHRESIRRSASEAHSWDKVGCSTVRVYGELSLAHSSRNAPQQEV